MTRESTDCEGEPQREQRSIEGPIGTVYEAGRDRRFVKSPSGTVHERSELEDGEGYALDPKCGQTLSGSSLWAGFDADTAEEVAERFEATKFCSKCFVNSLRLSRLSRKARENRRRIGGSQ